VNWHIDGMGGLDGASEGRRPSGRAQRALVRVLLALRGEASRGGARSHDRARAEALADRIILELPRSVLPLGIAAGMIVFVVCTMPLMRDAVAPADPGAVPVSSVVERGIRENGAALSDGLGALREIIAPFAAESEPVEEPSSSAPPANAAAPFSRS
jgi:hypothetical protein